MSQTTHCCPEAYRTRNNRGQNKTYIIMAGSSAYKGWTCPRPVTPCSSSEWTPTSIAGLAVLVHQVCLNAILLRSGSHLPQSQVADLAVCSGCLEPPLAETMLHPSRLDLLFEEVNLTTQ